MAALSKVEAEVGMAGMVSNLLLLPAAAGTVAGVHLQKPNG